jgi:hypothetical protein
MSTPPATCRDVDHSLAQDWPYPDQILAHVVAGRTYSEIAS